MKRYVFILLLALPLYMSATTKNASHAVSMVSYEQGWLDSQGTLALRNNTDDTIRNIKFLIKYYDMAGNQLDYEEFSSHIEIAPGMTRKLNIRAYEYPRNYSYYKSESSYSSPHRFKIKFELIGYNNTYTNTEKIAEKQDSTYSTSLVGELSEEGGGIAILGVLLVIVIALGIWVGMYILVATMAQRRRRNAALWVLVSLFTTPLLAIIILLCIGKSYDYYETDEQ